MPKLLLEGSSSGYDEGSSSTGPRGNPAYQRALLQFSASHLPSVDKAFPPPSVVIEAPSTPGFVKSPSPVNNLNSMNSPGPIDNPSPSPSPDVMAENPLFSSRPFRIQRLVCIDPEMHGAESHAEYHHPGLLKGADFCDSGVESAPDTSMDEPDKGWHLFPFGNSSRDPEEKPLIGRMYRALTGGDICEQLVDVSAHKHYGHSSAVKVRPTIGIALLTEASHTGHDEVSKVGPLARIPFFTYPQEVLELPQSPKSKVDPVPLVDQTELEADPIIQDPPFGAAAHIEDAEESVIYTSSEPVEIEPLARRITNVSLPKIQDMPPEIVKHIHEIEESVIYDSRDAIQADSQGRRITRLTFGSTPWKHSEDQFPGTGIWVPVAEESAGHVHQGHSHISKVKPAPGDSYHTNLGAGGHFMANFGPSLYHGFGTRDTRADSMVHPERLLHHGHSTTSKVQPCKSRPTSPGSLFENGTGASRKSSGYSRPSLSGKLDLKRTVGWFRDLIRAPEPYTTRLTNLPEKKAARGDSNILVDYRIAYQKDPVPHSLGRSLTVPASIDNKFKETVNNLEQLLSEATALANQVAEREGHQCTDSFELPNMNHHSALRSPPSIHESLPSADGSSDDEGLSDSHQQEMAAKETKKPELERSISKVPVTHAPKRYRSAPGMHSRNVTVKVPKRISSISKTKLGAELQPILKPHTNGFQEHRLSKAPPLHQMKTQYSFPPLQEQPGSDSDSDSASPAGCLTKGGMARRIRSCGNCRIPTVYYRSSFQHPTAEEIRSGSGRPRNLDRFGADNQLDGRTRRSGSWSFDGANDEEFDRAISNGPRQASGNARGLDERRSYLTNSLLPRQQGERPESGEQAPASSRISLRGRSHVSIRGYQGFNLARAYRRQPVARDWSTIRKRFVAAVACLSTAAIGILIGIYAGLVPSIQYWIADFQHYAILGNVFFYLGLAIPTFLFWPLPLLHGRKPYILSSLIVAMPLLFPQAIAVTTQRSPYVSTWRWALLGSRAFMGLTLGFASMNFHSILTDLFGASLMSGNPHQEVVDKYDVRRHGGGMGVWLGIWTWCFTGSLGVGFLIGAAIINTLNPSWGFYISIILIAVVLLLNVVCPEVRRSPFRRSVAEVRNGNQISRRVARGEVMMHRVKDGPTWWWQEVYHGILLSLEMLRQPGFFVMAFYTGWIYAQVVLVIVLLGSLTSRYYMLKSPPVGLCVSFVSIGALVAVPFQKANVFSRGRHHQQLSSEATMTNKRFSWTSRLLRRAIFCIFLPLVGIGYALASTGPPVPVEVPVLLAALVGNLSGLAISESNGLIMETFDCSDLQPGMTGRPRGSSNRSPKRTNYSSFPRVTAGFAICHTIGFVLAAVATGIGGVAQRNLGQQAATGVVAGILVILTVLLLAVLIRFKEVQIIPSSKTVEMEKWTQIRRESIRRRSSQPRSAANQNTMTDEEMWRPILIGNPSEKMRRVNILELGAMTRWTEIRKKNRLIDETAAHLNRAALESAAEAVEEATGIGAKTTDLIRRVSSRRSKRNASPRHFHSRSPGPSGAVELNTLQVPGQTFPDHFKTRGAGDDFSERECVMGQTVMEENEGLGDLVSSESDGGLYTGSDHGAPVSRSVRPAREFRREVRSS
ncbi:hypothetical protein B0H63DRAFT_436818 [Podospora didyma]|uniref:Polyamine transport protein n=1 Tax=Podospora didyma TaxID=330526 RepID=A0AAE0KLF6_9PEZI|nr:hypothetical protein B0H63DRAFT_436818 [Podospora didyma]